MSDSETASFVARRTRFEVQALEDNELWEDVGCFGWLRGVRDRAVMLELRKKNGNILAVGYAWLERMEFDPSTGIVLHLAGHHIAISGRNLNAQTVGTALLFEGLTRHRVPWVREARRDELVTSSELACVVESIEW
jgi:hypothetical protein